MNKPPRTVFITNMARDHEYAGAARYGALRPITSGNYPIYKTPRLLEEIVQALVDSDADDYLCISGSSIVAALCLWVWIEMHRKCNMLLFRPADGGSYLLRVLDRAEVRNEIEHTRDRLKGRPSISGVVRRDTKIS